MNVIKSILFWLFLGITCISLFPIALVIRIVTGPFDRRLRLLHRFTSFWASLYTWLNPFWGVSILHKTTVDPEQTYVIVSNHQSLVDIFAFFRTFVHFKWVSKSENFKFPFVGWNMRLNRYIEIKRGSNRSSAEMMKQCENTLRSGSSIFIFPEGTRSTTGMLGKFKMGAFELAKRTGLPILPMVVHGSSNALPKGGLILSGIHRIRIHIIDAITADEVNRLSADELCDLTRNRIETELALMQG